MSKIRGAVLTGAFLLLGTVGSAQALPVIYNDTIPAGTAAFDAAVVAAGSAVNTDALSGLSSGTTWVRTDYTITSTNGTSRFIDSSYIPSGDSIGINPSSVNPETSGLTFTFGSPVNAFGLEIGDWATCCFPSSLYISFDGGATRLVATANTDSDNPGYAAGLGYLNFVGAVDDTNTFTTVTFYGDGYGEYLVAGGTIRYATVAQGSFTGAPEPGVLALLSMGLVGVGLASRRRKMAQ